MFEELTNQFEDAVKAFKGEAKISEENVDEALKQVRRALLDADVSLSVVKEFIEEVRVKAVGTEVVRGIDPGQTPQIKKFNLLLKHGWKVKRTF